MNLHWYAIKVFWRRTEKIVEALDAQGMEFYAQNLVPSYMFIHTDAGSIKKFRDAHFGRLYLYADPVTHKPTIVPDAQVDTFRRVCAALSAGLEPLPDLPEKYAVGDLVRVVEGPFKGVEGYVRRIKKDRRLVVVVSGVAAFATTYIPPELLEKVEKQDSNA